MPLQGLQLEGTEGAAATAAAMASCKVTTHTLGSCVVNYGRRSTVSWGCPLIGLVKIFATLMKTVGRMPHDP